MIYRGWRLIPIGTALCKEFTIEIYNPNGEMVHSVLSISSGMDWIDELRKQMVIPFPDVKGNGWHR